jgi:hypothetical protein
MGSQMWQYYRNFIIHNFKIMNQNNVYFLQFLEFVYNNKPRFIELLYNNDDYYEYIKNQDKNTLDRYSSTEEDVIITLFVEWRNVNDPNQDRFFKTKSDNMKAEDYYKEFMALLQTKFPDTFSKIGGYRNENVKLRHKEFRKFSMLSENEIYYEIMGQPFALSNKAIDGIKRDMEILQKIMNNGSNQQQQGGVNVEKAPEFPKIEPVPEAVMTDIKNIVYPGTQQDGGEFENYWRNRLVHNKHADDLKYPKISELRTKAGKGSIDEMIKLNASALGIILPANKEDYAAFTAAKNSAKYIWFESFGIRYKDKFNDKYIDRIKQIMIEYKKNTILNDLEAALNTIAEGIDAGNKWNSENHAVDNRVLVESFKVEVLNLLYVNMAMGIRKSFVTK